MISANPRKSYIKSSVSRIRRRKEVSIKKKLHDTASQERTLVGFRRERASSKES